MIRTSGVTLLASRLGIDEQSINDFVNFTQYAKNPNSSQLYVGINSQIYVDPLTKFSHSLKRIICEKSFETGDDRNKAITSRAKKIFDEIILRSPCTREIKEETNSYLNQLLDDLKEAPESYAKRALMNWIQTTFSKEAASQRVNLGQVVETGFTLLNENSSQQQILSIAVYPHMSFAKNIERMIKNSNLPPKETLQAAALQVADFCEALNKLNDSNLSDANKSLIRNSLSIYALGAEQEILKYKERGEAALEEVFTERKVYRPSEMVRAPSKDVKNWPYESRSEPARH